MQGLKLSRIFYHEAAAPLLQNKLGTAFQRLAIGLVGEGSECFGFDDTLSRDHDFGAGFCIWIAQEEKAALEPLITPLLAALPRTFMGFPVRMTMQNSEQQGQAPHLAMQEGRVGVFSIEEFYQRFTNSPTPPSTWQQWYTLPEHFLAVCTNGEVFFDGAGTFSAFRHALLDFYPEDVRRKKLAARLGTMAQSGQYNLLRLLQRGDGAGAHLARTRFVENALAAYFLIHKRYMPFYKWAFTSVAKLPQGKEFSRLLQEVLCINIMPAPQEDVYASMGTAVEQVCLHMVHILQEQGLSKLQEPWLMAQAQFIQDSITTPQIQGLPLLHGISYS